MSPTFQITLLNYHLILELLIIIANQTMRKRTFFKTGKKIHLSFVLGEITVRYRQCRKVTSFPRDQLYKVATKQLITWYRQLYHVMIS